MDCRIWNGVEIQRRPADGFVNATAMCKAGGREWFTYFRSERTQSYLVALGANLGSPQKCGDLIQVSATGLNHLRGTWIHPRLAVDLARWISPAFAVWMDGWFLEVMQAQAQPAGAAAAAMASRSPGNPLSAFGFSAVTAPAEWTRIVEVYATEMETAMQGKAQIEVPMSLRFARPVATHFMGWLVNRYAQLVIPSTCKFSLPVAEDFSVTAEESSVVAFPVPPVPATPATPATPESPNPPARRRRSSEPRLTADPWMGDQGQDLLVHRRSRAQQQEPLRRFRPGERIAGPELARILGITTNRINEWSRHQGVGACRDGWRLIGQGKIACGDLGSTLPPGRASWLFERL
jgi:hypothetical protein